jgi:hypothetical protein
VQERRKRQHADLIADLQPDQRFAPRAISARSAYEFDPGRSGKGNGSRLNSETFASRAFNISRYILSVLQKARLWKLGSRRLLQSMSLDSRRFDLDQRSEIRNQISAESRCSRRSSSRSRSSSGCGSDGTGGGAPAFIGFLPVGNEEGCTDNRRNRYLSRTRYYHLIHGFRRSWGKGARIDPAGGENIGALII